MNKVREIHGAASMPRSLREFSSNKFKYQADLLLICLVTELPGALSVKGRTLLSGLPEAARFPGAAPFTYLPAYTLVDRITVI